jgi:membrane-bound lytic murein transglycosylase D
LKKTNFIITLVIGLLFAGYLGFTDFDKENPSLKEYMENSQAITTYEVPKEFNFAGEPVPLSDPEVKERFDREIVVNTYLHSSTIFNIKRAARWLPQIEPILKKHGIPDDFKYLAIIESGLINAKSPKGAVGFWQILEETGKELGLEVNEEVDFRYDPIKSTEAACKYLKKAYDRFGNWTLAAASYNVGMTGLSRSINDQKIASYFDLYLNEETSRYVFRIMALKLIMQNPTKYGFNIPEDHLYKSEKYKQVTVDKSITDLADFALLSGITYKTLKVHNPWLRKKTLTIKKPGTVYTLLIPENPPPLDRGKIIRPSGPVVEGN